MSKEAWKNIAIFSCGGVLGYSHLGALGGFMLGCILTAMAIAPGEDNGKKR